MTVHLTTKLLPHFFLSDSHEPAPRSWRRRSKKLGFVITPITENSALIDWSTPEPTTSKVYYAPKKSSPAQDPIIVENTAFVLHHTLLLIGLAMNTLYCCRIELRHTSGNILQSSERSFRFSLS